MPNDVGQNLKAFLEADAGIAALVGTRIHQNTVPQEDAFPFIWFQQRGIENEDGLADAAGSAPFWRLFDLEIVDDDIDGAINLATLVRAKLHLYRGPFGDGQVQGIFVENQSEEYVPRNSGGDEGLHVCPLDVRICPR